MPLTSEDNAFLKGLFQNLTERPLDPSEPLDKPMYVPLYKHLGDDDPVVRLAKVIQFSEIQSRQFFSGFRGSGKSTELKRLKQVLEGQGYFVYYADALEYLNPALPVEIEELLVLLAGAFSDVVEKEEAKIGSPLAIAGESYWTRFRNFLTTTKVQLDEIEVGLLADTAKLKLAIRDTPSFRQKLQQSLSLRLYEVESQVKKFFEDYVKALRERHPSAAGIVFLFDNLEQLRGSTGTEQVVIGSVQKIFSVHKDRLTIPYVHVVYTVPPWLKLLLPAAEVEILPSIVQWSNDDSRSPKAAGDACLQEVIQGRFREQGFKRFFRDEDQSQEFVEVCGGNLRDLIRLLREAILRANVLPVTDPVINASIRTIREQFLPIPNDDAIWLAKIAQNRKWPMPDRSPQTIARFTLFLDTHLVLFLRNGDEWYDVHPLVREHLQQMAVGEAQAPAGQGE